MKRFGCLLLLVAIVTFASAQSNAQKLTDLLTGVINFENANVNADRPIANINQLAAQQADSMMVLTKENATDVFNEAKKYQQCIVSVGQHTIVLVNSWTNCIQSGSWGYCMPYGDGYIQRGELEKKSDHINNIIGIPDSQRRMVLVFDKK